MKLNKLVPNLVVDGRLDQTLKFYQETLGFELVSVAPEKEPCFWASMRSGEFEIMFQTHESLQEEGPWREILGGRSIGGTVILYIEMEGIEAFYERIKNQVELVFKLADHPYGMREFTMRDGNGYILAFGQRI
jgi:lactoylglutathione lyase